MSFLFGSPVQVEILLDNDHEKEKVTKVVNKQQVQIPVYNRGEDVSGEVLITMKDKKYEHQGIKIEFIGAIEYSYDRSATSYFIQQSYELSRPAIITQEKTMFKFQFSGIDKKYDSYAGKNVRLRYFLRVSIAKKYSSGVTKEQEIWVVNYQEAPSKNKPILMTVGVDRCVRIEFKYAKTWYNMTDVVLGQVYFELVRLPLQSMELQIQRKETTGFAPNQTVDTEVLARYELMDGAPVKGESMPIRVFLANLDLTPTYTNINNMFSVTYHLHLVLIEEDGKRYFKQCEFKLWRKQPEAKIIQGVQNHMNTNCLAGCHDEPFKGNNAQEALPEKKEQEPEQQEPVKEHNEEAPTQPNPVVPETKVEEQPEPAQPQQEETAERVPAEAPKEAKPIDISSFIQNDTKEEEDLF